MHKNIFLVLLLIFSLLSVVIVQGVFLGVNLGEISTMPVKRADQWAITYDGILYMGNGYNNSQNDCDQTVYAYNPSNDTWWLFDSGISNLQRWNSIVCAVDDIVYIFGGETEAGSQSDEVFKFNLSQSSGNRWTQLNDYRGGTTASNAACAYWNNTIYIFGGKFSGSNCDDIIKYYPATDTYADTGESLPATWRACTAGMINDTYGLFVVAGGRSTDTTPTNLTVVYNASNNTCWQVDDMPDDLTGGSKWANPVYDVDNDGYKEFFYSHGMDGTTTFFSSVYCFNYSDMSWYTWNNSVVIRDGVAGCVIDDILYIVGGRNVSPGVGLYNASAYRLSQSSSIAFYSINDVFNNSVVIVSNRSFVWYSVYGASKYQLQVANDSGFVDVFLDLDNISEGSGLESMPGGSFTEGGGVVEFFLPYAYNVSWFDSHFYRVRAYV